MPLRYRESIYKSRAFLSFAKSRGVACCLCGVEEEIQLHHFGPKGMGQRGTDLLVARVCRQCHEKIQGKRRLAFYRDRNFETWSRLLEDAAELLQGYVQKLEGKE